MLKKPHALRRMAVDEIRRRMLAQARRDIPMLLELRQQPAFQRLLEEILAAPHEERVDHALQLLDVDAMRERGIQLPDGAKSTVEVADRLIENPHTYPSTTSVTFDFCIKVSLKIFEVSKCFKVTIEDVEVEL